VAEYARKFWAYRKCIAGVRRETCARRRAGALSPLSLGALNGLAQDQEPRQPGDEGGMSSLTAVRWHPCLACSTWAQGHGPGRELPPPRLAPLRCIFVRAVGGARRRRLRRLAGSAENASPCVWSESYVVRSRGMSSLCSQLRRSGKLRPRSEESESVGRFSAGMARSCCRYRGGGRRPCSINTGSLKRSLSRVRGGNFQLLAQASTI
jgi:hypothetical protein